MPSDRFESFTVSASANDQAQTVELRLSTETGWVQHLVVLTLDQAAALAGMIDGSIQRIEDRQVLEGPFMPTHSPTCCVEYVETLNPAYPGFCGSCGWSERIHRTRIDFLTGRHGAYERLIEGGKR